MNLDIYISNIQNFLNNNAAVDSNNIRSYTPLGYQIAIHQKSKVVLPDYPPIEREIMVFGKIKDLSFPPKKHK